MKNKIIIIAIIFFVSCKQTHIVFPLEAGKLTKEYLEKPAKSDRKYKNNILIIEGRISQVYTNKNNQSILILANVKDKYGVSCTLKMTEKISEPFRQYQLVEIKGLCTGFKENVIMENCVILYK